MGRYMDYMGKASVGSPRTLKEELQVGMDSMARVGQEMGVSGREPVTIGNGECIKETPDAILVELKRDRPDAHGFVTTDKQLWLPKSVLHDDSDVFKDGGTGKVIVYQWWAEKEGFA